MWDVVSFPTPVVSKFLFIQVMNYKETYLTEVRILQGTHLIFTCVHSVYDMSLGLDSCSNPDMETADVTIRQSEISLLR